MAKKEKKVTNNKENNSKESKNKKSFFKGLKAELKKVVWPTPKQLVNNTIAVITIVLITTIIVFILDLAFESVNKYGIDKIKESVQTITDENNTTESTENATNEGEVTDNNTTSEETTEGNNTENQTTSENTTTVEATPSEGQDATQESSANIVE